MTLHLSYDYCYFLYIRTCVENKKEKLTHSYGTLHNSIQYLIVIITQKKNIEFIVKIADDLT